MNARASNPSPARLFAGLFAIACGLPPLLAFFDVGPLGRADINGPPWLGLVAGGVFVVAGVIVIAGRRARRLREALGITLLVGLAALGNWIAFGVGARACTGDLSFAFFFVDGELSGWQCRLPFGIGALITDAICLYAIVALLQKRCGGAPALARTKRAAEGLLLLSLAPLLVPLLLVLLVRIAFTACRERVRTGNWPRNESFIRRQRAKGLLKGYGAGAEGPEGPEER